MTNPTFNFGWQMPTSTDLVTDLPADFEVFGQAVDTSMADLKGGTSGQILSKASNTDMDFTWITNEVGDITNIAVTSPITGGGSSGSVTIGVDAGTTSAAGVVQLTDSTSSTSTTTAATPNSVKTAYDLANSAAPKNLTLNAQTGTTYTFVLTDNSKLVTASNASAQTYSIPTNASVAFPIGTQINLIQIGAGQVTVNAVTPGTTTIASNAATSASPKCRNQYAAMTLIKVNTDLWYSIGDIA